MKSYCIKINDNKIASYLLNQIEKIDFNNIYYSNKQFKIYKNVILHYTGENLSGFKEFLTELICNTIFQFYEDKILLRIINSNYFYFDNFERGIILDNCRKMIEVEYQNKHEILFKKLREYIENERKIVLEGVVNFRIKKYIQFLDSIVDMSVNQYIIEKEYTEFISLLKTYINSTDSGIDILHLIYSNGESILLDKDKNIVSISDNIMNAKYLSDISFSSNDFALNTLLSILPERLDIHVIDTEDEFIETLKLIFENRVKICKDCNICRTYKMINNAKILR